MNKERFLYSRRTSPHAKWYGEAVLTRFLERNGFQAWHETYKLFDQSKHKENTSAIEALVGEKAFAKLRQHVQRARFQFSDPDVIGFHFDTDQSVFLEVKLDKSTGKDPMGDFQLPSLAAIRDTIPNSFVAVIRLVESDQEGIPLKVVDGRVAAREEIE